MLKCEHQIRYINEFTVLKWPPQSPDLNPIEHLWDMVERELRALDVHLTNLHQLQDAILSIWAHISKEWFQHLVESIPRIIKPVLKAKGGQTKYYYGVHNKPLDECVCCDSCLLFPLSCVDFSYFLFCAMFCSLL